MTNKLDRAVYELAARDALWGRLPVLIVDTLSVIVYCNERAAAAFGRTVDELCGMSTVDLLSEPFHALERAGESRMMRLLGSGRPVYGKHKDGTSTNVRVWFSDMELENKKLVVALVIDLTEAYGG